MERKITPDQERLLNLQERCVFSSLNSEEQQFVLRNSTPEEFDKFHFFFSESKALYSIPTPRTFNLPVQHKSRVLPYLIPISSAAAAAILTFFVFRKETIVLQEIEKPVYLTADTVFIQKNKVDTLIKTIIVKEKIYFPEKTQSYSSVELSVPQGDNEILPIQKRGLKNTGEKASEDNTVALIEGVML